MVPGKGTKIKNEGVGESASVSWYQTGALWSCPAVCVYYSPIWRSEIGQMALGVWGHLGPALA